jgi:glycoside/pentoside/hexuronide:cation symporter, GPH family
MNDISQRQRWLYALTNFGILLPGNFFNYLTFYYTDTLKADPVLIGSVLAIFAVWNAINNPLIGYLSDRTRTRWGRRLPYILFGIPIAYLLALAAWNPTLFGVTAPAALPVFLLALLCIQDVFGTGIGQSYFSLMPEMYPKYDDRTDVAVKMNLFQVLALFIGTGLTPLLGSRFGYGNVAVAFYALSALFIYIGIRGAFERNDQPRPAMPLFSALKSTFINRSFLTVVFARLMRVTALAVLQTGMGFYFKYSLGVDEGLSAALFGVAFLVMGIALAPWRRFIAARFGARNTYMIAFVVLIAGILPLFVITSVAGAIAAAVVIGISIAGIVLMNEVVLSDVIDEDELASGQRREGMYFGLDGFILTLGAAISSYAFAVVAGAYGYNPQLAQQPESVGLGFRVYIALVPIVCALLALAAMWVYPLTRTRVADVRAQLGRT